MTTLILVVVGGIAVTALLIRMFYRAEQRPRDDGPLIPGAHDDDGDGGAD